MLKYAIEHGIIDIAHIQDTIKMNKRKKILDNHPYKLWEGRDGKWRTYLPDEEKGRRMIKRTSKKDLESSIVEYYQNIEEVVTFKVMYYKWREVQDALVEDNTSVKYDTDYIRYFTGTEFESILIEEITEETIKVFVCRTIKKLKLCKKAAKTLLWYISSVMRSARINKMITDNPAEFLKPKTFYKYCEEKRKSIEQKIVSDQDASFLHRQFQEDYRKKPWYIPTYAVEFASLTGFRVSEISALTWESITDHYILVDKSEKYNRKTKTYSIGKTKNGEERIFPITPAIRSLLDRIKKVEMEYGYICEWVFANEHGRVHAPIISSCVKNKCKQAGVSEKGIHAYRKTINSKMRCQGVSATVAASLLGHTEDVNEEYYTFDVSNIDEKVEIVTKVNDAMCL